MWIGEFQLNLVQFEVAGVSAHDVPAADKRRPPNTAKQPGVQRLNMLTWLKGAHTWTFGGTFRRTRMYESIGGAPYSINFGVATGDPASSVFNSSTIPGIRSTDLNTALRPTAATRRRSAGRAPRRLETARCSSGFR
jgi:hypothetical protein